MGRRSGCLGGLVILALAGLVLSLLLPSAAGGLVELGLTAAGLRAEHLVVRVEADPPLRILLGRADRVVVEGSGITWDGTTAASLALVAADVDGPGLPTLVVLGAEAVRGLVLRSVAVEADGGVLVERRLDPGLLGLAL